MIRLRRPTSRFLIAATALAAASPHAALLAQQAHTPPALDVAGMDRSVRPGDNFFEYANGTWLKQTEIPADRSSYGGSAILIELTDRRVADLIQEAAKGNAPAGSDLRKIGDYYTSFMDTAAIDAAGLKPLQPALDSIAAIRDRKDLARVLGSGLRADVDAINATNFYTDNLFGLWVAQDLDDPTHYSPFLLQGGLGMPDRSYYVDSSAAMATIRAKYQEHIAAMLAAGKHSRRRHQGRGDRPARDPHGRGAREPRAVGRRHQGQQPLEAGRFRHQGAGPGLGDVFRRSRARPSRRRSSSGSPARSPASPLSLRASRSTPGRTT